jgi:ABC-type multidrug transport system fused ATPase/permease subunit
MKDSEYNNEVLYNNIFKGLITGFLIAYLVILGLRPAALYPDNMLDIIDNPWIFIILFIINFYIIQWDLTIGLLLFLSIIALILDIIIFTEGKIFYSIEDNKESFNEKASDTKTSNATSAMPVNSTSSTNSINGSNGVSSINSTNSTSSASGRAISLIFNRYKDINDIILNKIKEYTDKNYNKKTSINVYIR